MLSSPVMMTAPKIGPSSPRSSKQPNSVASIPNPGSPISSPASSISGPTIAWTSSFLGLGPPRTSNNNAPPETLSRFTPLPENHASIQSGAEAPLTFVRGYGQVVSTLAHAPRSTDDAGRYGFVTPAPIAGLPGDSAKLVPTGCVVSVPTEDVPTFTH